jgi:flagellar basal-body rod protein FlgF
LKELWVPVSAAIAQQAQIDVLANNVANANTPGFKEEAMVFKEHLTALEKGYDDIDLPNKEFAPEDFYHSHGSENSFVKVDGTYANFTQGALNPTNSPLDVALKGPGFLTVLTPNGVRYSRRGSLSLTREGILVTDAGHPVLSKGDFKGNLKERIIQFPRLDGEIKFNHQGEVFIKENKIADLNIAEFSDTKTLLKEGSSYFINRQPENLKEQSNTIVLQGFQEESNVNVINEMSKLIRANRNFESIQRAIKTYDNMAGKANNEILKF